MKVPSSTYRIQLNRSFPLKKLKEITGYLSMLGVSTLYAAPILKSKPGSMHGYDVIDPLEIDPEIGSFSELKELSAALLAKGITWLQDIVPNHMAFDTQNLRLMDVLERGPQSPYYHFFDINWHHPSEKLKGKVGVPFLGCELEACLEKKEMRVSFSEEGFTVDYFDTHYPVSIPALPSLTLSEETKPLIESYVRKAGEKSDLSSWQHDKTELNKALYTNARVRKELQQACESVSACPKKLLAFLDKQFYVLQYWKSSEKEINYRRFFTVNELICLNMQNQSVFDEYHQLIKKLYDDGIIHGVRIDHIDGLYDPSGYVKKLRQLLGPQCYIIAEKILEAKENMPGHWPLEGTSGYEFLSYVSQLITDKSGSKKLLEFYREVVPEIVPYNKLVWENKRLILENYMAGEWENLVAYFFELRLSRQMERPRAKQALALLMLALPVYRIYPDSLPLNENDLAVMEEAFQKATSNGPEYREELAILKTRLLSDNTGPEGEAVLNFLKRLMQFTGPLMAKGVEDTTFYVYNPLISHDEVGDAPDTLGISIAGFHARMIARNKNTPYSLNATATHDTKRGEDSRLRLNILSEMPDVWKKQVTEWRATHEPLRKNIADKSAPTANDEYFIYQSLVGGFSPGDENNETFLQRFREFLVKALREAKVNSNWSAPDEEYEQACIDFVKQILDREHTFLASFVPFVTVVTRYANIYALIQTLVKMTCPGIPDIYQGCELWDLSFVDPDNRREVNFEKRQSMLNSIIIKEKEGILPFFHFLRANRAEGYEKLFVTWKVLNFRKQRQALFDKGDYIPLEVSDRRTVVAAFARQWQSEWLLVLVPLALAANQLQDQPYADTPDEKRHVVLPESAPREWVNLFTGQLVMTEGRLFLFDAFRDFPVALFRNK